MDLKYLSLISVILVVVGISGCTEMIPTKLDLNASRVVADPKVLNVSGTTDPDAVVTINGEKIKVDAGKFNKVVTLNEGKNEIKVTAKAPKYPENNGTVRYNFTTTNEAYDMEWVIDVGGLNVWMKRE